MHVRVSIYGSGPRTRRIAGELVLDAVPNALVRTFEDRRGAERAAPFSTIPVVLLDARVAVAPDAFRAFALHSGNRIAFARAFDGEPSPVVAATRFDDGAATAAEPSSSASSPIGAWLEELEELRAGPAGLGCDFHSYGKGPSGFATASRNLMIGLHRAGVDVNWLHWVPENEDAEIVPQDRELLEGFETDTRRHDRAVVFHPPTHTGGQEYIEAYNRAFVGVPRACATMFETDGIPAQWVEPLLDCSRLWVPSAFNVETFAAGGVPREMIDLVPIGLDVENQPIDGPTLVLPERRSVAFLSVFEWTYRKGWDVLLAAWAKAFTRDDDATLIVRTSFRQLDIEDTIRSALTQWGYDPKRVAPIVVLPKKISQAELVALYRSADAYVLPTRGEGFGLPYLEAMALGLPVIGTAWSGMTDFVDERTGYLIEARLVPITSPMITRIVPIYRDQRWAEPSITSTVAQMRRVYEHRDEAARIGARGTAVARTQFNRTRIGRIAAQALHHVGPKRRSSRPSGASGSIAFAGSLYDVSGASADFRGLLAVADAEGLAAAIPMDGERTWISLVDRGDARRIRAGLARPVDERAPVVAGGAVGQLVLPDRGGARVARVVATEETLAADVIARLRQFDELWVPNQASADAFATAGIDPKRVHLVPVAIDTERWTPQTGGVLVTENATTLRLLAIIDWDDRSGWDLVTAAFLRAFEPTEDVALSYKIRSADPRAPQPKFQDDFVNLLRRVAPQRLSNFERYQVNIATGLTQYVDFISYFGSFDVLVHVPREIGWGRPLLEAMASGVAVVAPRTGSHRSFVTEDNAFLVDGKRTGPTHFDVDVDALAATLRGLFERREEIVERTRLARRGIVAEHSLEAAGRAVRSRVEALDERYHRITPSIEHVVPARASEIGIIVDARFEPAYRDRTLDSLERMTRGEHDIVVVDAASMTGLSDAFARLCEKPYVAYLRSDVTVAPSWDDFLIDALSHRPHLACVVPRTFDVPGVQGDLVVPEQFADFRDVDKSFIEFARSIELVHTGRGTPTLSCCSSCVVFERSVLSEALRRIGPRMESVEVLIRELTSTGLLVWVAQDSIVSNRGSGSRSMIDLRAKTLA